jgi:hypothetical protein
MIYWYPLLARLEKRTKGFGLYWVSVYWFLFYIEKIKNFRGSFKNLNFLVGKNCKNYLTYSFKLLLW